MIKGLISLFTSGIIFNPLVLLGIISGFWCITNKEPSEIRELFNQNWLYVIVGVVAIAYTFIFAKIYLIFVNTLFILSQIFCHVYIIFSLRVFRLTLPI